MRTLVIAVIVAIISYSNSNACEESNVHTVEIKGFEFVPATLTVKKGDKVVWVNRDTIPHNIVDKMNEKVLSTTLVKGDSFSYIVEGNLNYFCGFHPSMQAKIMLDKNENKIKLAHNYPK